MEATAVITPFFFLGNPSGHDIQFHISSWMDAALQWREGIVFPRWAEWANWGFGEPRFIFYPPISWLLGAGLGSILPWKMVPGAIVWIGLVVAGMSMWTLAREWLPGKQSIAAAVLFAAGPYHLVIAYYRSDFAELLGAALFPLLFWGVSGIASGEKHRIPHLAFVFALIWLCNAPTGVLATYTLCVILGVACITQRALGPLLHGGAAMALGFLLDAFYLIPAAYEQRWVQIAGALTEPLLPSNNFLFAQHNELGFLQFNARVTRVAMAMIVAACVAAIVAARQRKSLGLLWPMLIAAGALSIFLMFSPSLFLWKLLPKLWFVQFPWRWMDTLAVPLAFLVVAAAGSFRKSWAVCCIVLIAAAGIATVATLIGRDTWWDAQDAPYIMRGIRAGHGYDGTDEYAPLRVSHWDLPGEPPKLDNDELPPPPPETPRVEELNEETGEAIPASHVSVKYQNWTATQRTLTVSAKQRVSVILRLLNYPAWDVRVDGKHVQPGYVDTTGQMVLPLTAGIHQVDVRFRRTWDRTLGIWVSLVGLILWVASLIRHRDTEAQRRAG